LADLQVELHRDAAMQEGDDASDAGIRMSPSPITRIFFVIQKIKLIDENYYKLFLIFW